MYRRPWVHYYEHTKNKSNVILTSTQCRNQELPDEAIWQDCTISPPTPHLMTIIIEQSIYCCLIKLANAIQIQLWMINKWTTKSWSDWFLFSTRDNICVVYQSNRFIFDPCISGKIYNHPDGTTGEARGMNCTHTRNRTNFLGEQEWINSLQGALDERTGTLLAKQDTNL